MGSTLPPDPYEILGVAKDAPIAAIRSAHRKLVLQTHPDKVQDESLRAAKQDEFQRIQQAYELLSDETQRQQYDEQVRLSQQKRDYFSDRSRSGGGAAASHFEVRTAAPSREYDRLYEERRARRSFEDEQGSFRAFEEKVSPARYDSYTYRRPSRSYDDRKATRSAEDERERIRIERERQRQTDREYQSERRRTRDRDRRRAYTEKYARVDSFDDEEEENRYRTKVDLEEPPRRNSSDVRRSHARSSDEQLHRETTEKKLMTTREYIRQQQHSPLVERASSTTYYEASPPPMPAEDTVRRSSARRSVDRERRRGSTRSTPSRKNSGNDHIEIVEPAADEPRPKIIPSMPSSASSPAHIRIPSTPRMSPQTHRSATMQSVHEVRAEPPPLSRSSTMPSSPNTSARRDRVPLGSSKLKPSVIEVDSGYSSSGTPETPHLTSRLPSTPPMRHESGYFEDQDPGPRYRKVYVEESVYDRRERSISPHCRGRSSEHARPSLARETSGSTRLSPGRTTSYVYSRDTSSTPRAEPVLHRKETSSTRGPASFLRSESSGHHSRRLYGEVKYNLKDVQYSQRIVPENILFSDRPGSETIYRDAAPHSSRGHYAYGPHPGLMRAETFT